MNHFKAKKLTTNWKKTCYLPFTPYERHLPRYNTLNIGNKSISSVRKIKYLGVILDYHLRWSDHANCIVKILRSLIPKFKVYKNIFDIKTLKILYFSLVQSHLTNGIMRFIDVTQKWLIKVMLGKPKLYASNALFNDAQLLDVRQLFFRAIAIFQHKHKIYQDFISHTYNTRQSGVKLKIPKTHWSKKSSLSKS
ncbi:unnamed protein product, partial [Callosobruchus maculatus]